MTGSSDISQELAKIRGDLAARLQARAPEIEQAVITRIRDLSEPVGNEDAVYLAGLQNAVREALSFSLESLETGGEPLVPIPPETARQARRAAREGVRLATVLRRYAAGNKLLEEFIVRESEGISSEMLCQILSTQGLQVDRLMESVAEEFQDELEQTRRSAAQRESDRLVHLLESSSIVSPPEIDHDFDAWHVGMVVIGHGASLIARSLTQWLGFRSLHVVRDDETTWAWISSQERPVVADLEARLAGKIRVGASIAIGEPRKGLGGWRQTHYEAKAALQVLLCRPNSMTRCRDVILDAAVLRDQWLTKSLIETYLAPLDAQGNSGEVLRKTLRAYFAADQSVASAALALGKSRNTVERHLRRVEEKLDQTLNTCNAQLQVALRVEERITSVEHKQSFSRA